MFNATEYWDERYRAGGTSGSGSRGRLAAYKTEVLQEFIAANKVQSVVELGCGDGYQAAQLDVYRYYGLDVSLQAVKLARAAIDDKVNWNVDLMHTYDTSVAWVPFDLAISMDVIYHIIDDAAFHNYMRALFSATEKSVIIYSSNTVGRSAQHVQHREFSAWVKQHEKHWRLDKVLVNPYAGESSADFYFYTPIGSP